MTSPSGERERLATPEEVSEFLGVPLATLYQWRSRRTGPQSAKIGRYIRYRWTNVYAFVDAQSTEAA